MGCSRQAFLVGESKFRPALLTSRPPSFRFRFRVAERTSVTAGLKGCIRLLDVNNQMYDLREKGSDVLYGSGVGECGNNPCHPNPCHHGSLCHVKEAEMFHCECLNGYTGGHAGVR